MLSCSIWFSVLSFWMGGGLESRCVGRVYGAVRTIHTVHTNIADLVNLKCEKRNHYEKCVMCQHCWLLCTSYGEHRTARTSEEIKGGAPRIFFHLIGYISKELNFTKQNILLHV
jgi:hypothetical protein